MHTIQKSVQVQPKNTAPLSFIENKGQITDQYFIPRADIQFKVAAAPGLNIFLGNGAIHYQFANNALYPTPSDNSSPLMNNGENLVPPSEKSTTDRKNITELYRMDVKLLDANPHAQVITGSELAYYENHMNSGHSNSGFKVKSYSSILYKDIYPNIDWYLYIDNGQLEHEFIVKAGGDPAYIQLQYDGATNLQINADGSLTATTPQGTINEKAPICFQNEGRMPVQSRFQLHNNTLTYGTGHYSGTLIIDPTVSWATYYGGTGAEYGNAVITDTSGKVYVTGATSSTTDIATVGAYQITLAGSQNAFIAKFDHTGAIVWATYFGGSGTTVGNGIAISDSNIYITGATTSTSGIATLGAFSTVYSGGISYGDAYLAKFSTNGSLVWATYYGGTGDDAGNSLTTDTAGNVYITGFTMSSSGIATSGAYDTVFGGGATYGDAFFAKFSSSGARLWGTYFGGTGDDQGNSIVANRLGDIYIAGATGSPSNIATAGAYQTTYADSTDGFLAKFSFNGFIEWATYYGGIHADGCQGVAFDGTGDVYVAGFTFSDAGIATSGAYLPTYGGGGDAFVAKFSPLGARKWGTYYGGSEYEGAIGLAINNAYEICITGKTLSTTGIATSGAYQTAFAGGTFSGDAYLGIFDTTGSVLQYGSYYGGSNNDAGYSVGCDATGNIYITGWTSSTSGIATTGSYLATYGGGGTDAFLTKFCNLPVVPAITGSTIACIGQISILHDSVTGGTWAASNGKATISDTVLTGIATGIDTITYTITNTCGMVASQHIVTVNPIPSIAPVTSQTLCPGTTTTAVIFTGTLTGTVFNWTNNDTAIGLAARDTGSIASFTVRTNSTSPAIGTIIVTPTLDGCSGMRDTLYITVLPHPNAGTIVGSSIACLGMPTTLYDRIDSGVWNMTNGNASVDSTYLLSGVRHVIISGNTLGADSLVYRVTTACGTATVTFGVTVNPLPEVDTIAGNTIVCFGSSITLTDDSTGGLWTTAIGNASIVGGILRGVATGMDTVFYTITSPGCGNAVANKLITIDTLPVNGAINGLFTLCAGNSATLTASSAGGTWGVTNSNAIITAGGVISAITNGNDTVYYMLSNICGSDTAIQLMTINPLPSPTIVQTDSTVSVSSLYSSYQWYFNGNPISGATNSTYYTTDTGNYYVIVTNSSGCNGNSNTLDVNNLAVPQTNLANVIIVYPNPAHDIIYIQSFVKVDAELTAIDGRILMQQKDAKTMDLHQLADGIYFVNIYNSATGLKLKTQKIVKEE